MEEWGSFVALKPDVERKLQVIAVSGPGCWIGDFSREVMQQEGLPVEGWAIDYNIFIMERQYAWHHHVATMKRWRAAKVLADKNEGPR